jgi:hypothetical protein
MKGKTQGNQSNILHVVVDLLRYRLMITCQFLIVNLLTYAKISIGDRNVMH